MYVNPSDEVTISRWRQDEQAYQILYDYDLARRDEQSVDGLVATSRRQ